VSKEVLWVFFSRVQWNSFVSVESSGKVVAVNNSEDSLVDAEVDTKIEIPPYVVGLWDMESWINGSWIEFVVSLVKWQFVTLKENSLWNSGVFNSWFFDVEGVIIKIIVNNAFSNSKVLVSIFNNWFLEISVEA